jgi:BirA family biotin operon repressor/biotin-[acetyl-CoA-carboxylase] ligase
MQRLNDTQRALLSELADGPVRGPDLADELGVSRTAVWKAVEALRGTGFGIESTDEGYAVRSVPEYGAAAIEYGLEAPYTVEYHDVLASSNDRARELAEAGAEDVAVVADEQTAPRGRLSREWSSPPGGIWLSLLVRPEIAPSRAPLFTLATAVAITRAAREAGVDAGIKWPNDVVVQLTGDDGVTTEGKLSGILTEMEGEADRVSWIVVGIGVNANVDPGDLPAGVAATSVRAEVGDIDRRAFTQHLLEEFDDLRSGPDAVLPAWRGYAATLGRRVRVETRDGPVVGEAVDVALPGALVVETADGRVEVTAGDCEHLRPDDG